MYQSDNQNTLFEEVQTIQWPKGQAMVDKYYTEN